MPAMFYYTGEALSRALQRPASARYVHRDISADVGRWYTLLEKWNKCSFVLVVVS